MIPLLHTFTTPHGHVVLNLLQIESMVASHDVLFDRANLSVKSDDKIPVVVIRTKSGIEWRVLGDANIVIPHVSAKIAAYARGRDFVG